MGVKNIKKQLALLAVIVLVMLTVSGVYAEDIDVDSSDVAVSPVSADVDTSLSSDSDFNNDLSYILQINEKNSYAEGNSQESNISVSDIDCVIVDSYNRDGYDQIRVDCADVDNEILRMPAVDGYCEITQSDTLLESDKDMLAICGINMLNADESVLDSTLIGSEYISVVEEVYRGLLSGKDNNKLLKVAGSSKTLLFAKMAKWYNGTVRLETLQNIANNNQSYEGLFDVNAVTNALLKYYPQENEWWIYKFSDSEDEQSHLINDSDSYALDYAYDDVINEDMLNSIVLTSYGIVFIEEQSSAELWEGLNDVMDEISSKSLLPDDQAIWTPLLLLKQNDSDESSADSHTDDKNKKNTVNKKSSNNVHESDSNDKSHLNGGINHQGYLGGFLHYYDYATVNVASELVKSDNSTDNETNSTNITHNVKKDIESPEPNQNVGPTYTLVYAIIGIVFISILFNSSYIKRDD